MDKKILAIIPAKGVSKRIPGKNIKNLAGKPMIAYILETALSVGEIDRVIVSTESKKVALVARKYGAEVPFIRPVELTRDDVPTIAVLQHALGELERRENYIPDYVLLLYPTSPLLSKERIVQGIDLALKIDSGTVFSGTLDKGHYWIEVDGGWQRLYPLKQMNSQYQVPLVRENGAFYLTKASILKRQYAADKSDVVIMGEDENVDVDYPQDFKKVEEILKVKKRTR